MSKPIRKAVVRPTEFDLKTRIRQAKECLKDKEGLFANPGNALGELEDLGLEVESVWSIITQMLDEIEPRHYTGSRPPQSAYEKQIEGKPLYAFSWDCKILSMKLYLKFVIQNGEFYYVSLHEDRPIKTRK